MIDSVFAESRFWLLVVLSFLAPLILYAVLTWKRSIVRRTVFLLGLSLFVVSAVDMLLLQSLADLVHKSASVADDIIFASELSLALYAFPIFFGGLGANIVSHVVIEHLVAAERRYDRTHPAAHTTHAQVGRLEVERPSAYDQTDTRRVTRG